MLRSLFFGSVFLVSVSNAMAAPSPSHTSATSGNTQAKGSQITLNLKDADIREVAQLVSSITGKNFIVDPRAQGRVTVISARPISADALFSVFLSVLNVHGLAAIPSGNDTWKIVPAIEGRQSPGVNPSQANAPGDAMVTRVVQLHSVTVAQLVPALRPLMSIQAQLAAYAPSNMLIISGRVDNVRRIMRLAGELDQPIGANFSLIQLKYASAVAISQVLTSMLQGGSSQGQLPMKLAADPRTNSILVSGSPAQQLQVKALVSQLDEPTGKTGDTQVLFLHYAQSSALAKILQDFVKSKAQENKAAKGAGTEPTLAVSADTALNALIVTAPPKSMSQINQLVKSLDVRQAQVLVQGIIAELSSDESAQLGISWGALSSGAAGITNFPGGLGSLAQLAESIAGGGTSGTTLPTVPTLPDGALFGVGHIVSNGTSFVALLNALASDSSANILSTPSLVTLNNKTATLVSGQKVPFVSGQYTNTTGANSSGANVINPFQTVNRTQLGINLKIKPQINYGGNSVTLNIDAKDDTLGTTQPGTTEPSTNNREVKTTIIAKDKQILVLGGLISDQSTLSKEKVPLLGDIPLLGNLFRYRSSEKTRENLMIFLRPTILRNADDTDSVTTPRYNQIRQLEMGRGDSIPLLPGVKPPVMPALNTPTSGSVAAPETATLILPAPAATHAGTNHGQHR
ncbi:MAG: type II secretion system secretin GspD [Gammaproteobacteria bacterium]